MSVRTFDFDDEVVGTTKEIKKVDKKDDSYDFNLGDSKNGLVMFAVINEFYSMKQLLEDVGIEVYRTNMYCPFHDDELGGKPSAKFHEDSDTLYCFSESKLYSAYHVVKQLYPKKALDSMFQMAWANLAEDVRHKIMLEYSGDTPMAEKDYCPEIWRDYHFVVEKFSLGEVTLKQHRNALHKLFLMIYDSQSKF